MAVFNTYQVGEARRTVEVNILLLSVESILHLQMLTMHAISSVVNVLQHQIQEVVPSEETVEKLFHICFALQATATQGLLIHYNNSHRRPLQW